ncbi:MAG: hypothetical protein IJ618_06410 [Prevotella sp.]|nr:hypothetical protein [Prevotella sp.]
MPPINYKSDETVKDAFMHSCLGKLVILAGIVAVMLVLAYVSTPTGKEMMAEMDDNVLQCLEENDSIQGDMIDDYVHNLGFIFTTADTTQIVPDLLKAYRQLNRIEVYHHALYSTAYIFNNMHPEGLRIGIGAYGLVVPTLTFKDLLLDVGPIHKGYNQKIIQTGVIPDTDLGTNPNIQEYHYKRNPDD